MSTIKGKNVLITGGASGIGRLMALESLKEGADKVIIWDIDEPKGKQLREESGQAGRIAVYRVDVANAAMIREVAQEVLEDHRRVDILINNAGIVVGKGFKDHEPDDISRTVSINIEGVMQTTRAFLPSMIERGSGHIVNIASAAGLMANPGMSVYVGSKWAVTGWSESLRLELRKGPGSIEVTTVQPGFIDTGMFRGVSPPLLTPLLKPEAVAHHVIRAIRKNKRVLREPFMVKLIPFLKGILPDALFHLVAGKLFRVYKSMDTFKGRGRGR